VKLERLLDTTLREGEQTPGVYFKPEERLKIAEMLSEAIDPEKLFIEIGFAYNQFYKNNLEQTLRELGKKRPELKTLLHARMKEEDIVASYECGSFGVVVYLPVSEKQLTYKLKKSFEWALGRIEGVISYAKKEVGFKHVQYTLEDATAVPMERAIETVRTALRAGADVIRIADTSSRMDPWDFGDFVKKIKEATNAEIDVHCHNDRGLAIANAISGLKSGATGVHTCILGIGERCGIPDLMTLVEDLESLYNVDTGVKHELIPPIYQYVSACTGISIPKNHPIIGRYARTHKAGTHQLSVLNELRETGRASTYEVVDFSKWGLDREFEFGSMQSRELTRYFLEKGGVNTNEDDVNRITERIRKESGERNRPLTQVEVRKIVKEEVGKDVNTVESGELRSAIVALKVKTGEIDEVSMKKDIIKICFEYGVHTRIDEVTGDVDYFVSLRGLKNYEILDSITEEIRREVAGIDKTATYIVLDTFD